MTQEEIIEITRQAGGFDATPKFLERFANLVAAKATAVEREACAQVAEQSFGVVGSTIALAIRARAIETKLKDKNCVG
jgi:hypothetical protein